MGTTPRAENKKIVCRKMVLCLFCLGRERGQLARSALRPGAWRAGDESPPSLRLLFGPERGRERPLWLFDPERGRPARSSLRLGARASRPLLLPLLLPG